MRHLNYSNFNVTHSLRPSMALTHYIPTCLWFAAVSPTLCTWLSGAPLPPNKYLHNECKAAGVGGGRLQGG